MLREPSVRNENLSRGLDSRITNLWMVARNIEGVTKEDLDFVQLSTTVRGLKLFKFCHNDGLCDCVSVVARMARRDKSSSRWRRPRRQGAHHSA